jgi:hypothetical protein
VDARLSPHELARPWRTATLVASAIAAVELCLLVGAGLVLFGDELSAAVQKRAESAALSPTAKPAAPSARRATAAAAVPAAKLTRAQTSVMVLNGNGRSGSAATAASNLRGLGYVVAATGNARRQDYATSVVMYRPGHRGEALRLARDLKVKVVGPLDGMPASSLMGGHLAVVIGA